jgi:adenylate cyclase class 2
MEEIEVKFLNIDRESLEQKIREIGAEKVKDFLLKHVSFDYPDRRLDQDNSWIRLRDENDKITLTFKKRLGVTSQDGSTNDEGMEEIEFEVGDYEKARLFLARIGFEEKHANFEKRRSRWLYKGIEFDIDEIPLIPEFWRK